MPESRVMKAISSLAAPTAATEHSPETESRLMQEFCAFTHPEYGPCVYGKGHRLPDHAVDVSDEPEHHRMYTLLRARFKHFDLAGREVELDGQEVH